MNDLAEQARVALAAEIAAAKLAEQRRRDAQHTCEVCGDVEADYNENFGAHICPDCALGDPNDDAEVKRGDDRLRGEEFRRG